MNKKILEKIAENVISEMDSEPAFRSWEYAWEWFSSYLDIFVGEGLINNEMLEIKKHIDKQCVEEFTKNIIKKD